MISEKLVAEDPWYTQMRFYWLAAFFFMTWAFGIALVNNSKKVEFKLTKSIHWQPLPTTNITINVQK